MALSHDVTLEPGTRAVWPDVCVRCEMRAPDDRYVLTPERSGMAWLLPGFLFWGQAPVLVPACAACTRAMGWARFWRTAIEWGVVVVAIAVALVVSRLLGFDRTTTRWVAIGTPLIAFTGLVLVQIRRPAFVHVTRSSSGELTYEFKLLMAAARFAVANGKTGADIH